MWQPGPSVHLQQNPIYSYTHRANGLQVLLCPVVGSSICAYMRAVSAGSKDENGKTGSAHFIEHMSFRIQDGKIWSLASKGDVINAETNMDSTRFYVVHLPHQTADTISIDAERYKQASVPAEKVPVELHAVLNKLERGERAGNKMFHKHLLWQFSNIRITTVPLGHVLLFPARLLLIWNIFVSSFTSRITQLLYSVASLTTNRY